jgi:hypothetical protein
MTIPMDPNDLNDEGPTEYSWGPGLFPPGIANNEGQTKPQDDFGENLIAKTVRIGDVKDNYARAVADRRTDPTDPESNRDFETLGNPDRFGGNPPLIRSEPQPNKSQFVDTEVPTKVARKW